MPFAESNNAHIHFGEYGEGAEVIVLIQGLGCRASEWGAQFLSLLAQRRRVVCIDHRGVALSRTSVDTWTLSDMANDVRSVLDTLGLQRATIAGTSMGGLVAQTLAIESPNRVSRLVLASTGLPYGEHEMHLPRAEAIGTLFPKPGLPAVERQRRMLGTLTAPGFAEANPDLIVEIATMRAATPIAGYVLSAHFEAMFLPQQPKRAGHHELPVLVVHGEDDPLIPIESGRLLAAATPGARSAWLSPCGHYPHLEKPVEFAHLIETFIRETDERDRSQPVPGKHLTCG